ncbi:MAG TPA: hypothetical protein VNI79_08565 [Sphingomicrobium sp.]|nr:hypothetical protein [Sphingomicrobium sp.]
MNYFEKPAKFAELSHFRYSSMSSRFILACEKMPLECARGSFQKPFLPAANPRRGARYKSVFAVRLGRPDKIARVL